MFRHSSTKPCKMDFHKALTSVLHDNPELLRKLQDLREYEQRQWEYETLAEVINNNPTIPDKVAAYAVQRSRTAYTAAKRAEETQKILAHFGR